MNNDLVELKKAIKSGGRLSDENVRKLAQLRRSANADRTFVRVGKLALQEGEELMEFVWTMISAVQTDRIILADGSLDAWLEGIFDDHIIVRDGNTGRLFRADFARGADGSIAFAEPVEVRVQFVPISQPGASEGDGTVKSVEKRAPDQIVEIKKAESKWSFLPASLRGR